MELVIKLTDNTRLPYMTVKSVREARKIMREYGANFKSAVIYWQKPYYGINGVIDPMYHSHYEKRGNQIVKLPI